VFISEQVIIGNSPMLYSQEAFWSPIPPTARVATSHPSIASGIAKIQTFRVFFVVGIALICIWCSGAPRVDRCGFVGSSPGLHELHELRLN
jgi:hypothetical protein